jgi:hypothetical protein
VAAPQLAVILALLVSTPTWLELLHGQVDAAGALVRFFLALVVCWLAANALASATASYWAGAKPKQRRADSEAGADQGGTSG